MSKVLATPIIHSQLTHVSTFEVEVPKDFTLDRCPRTYFKHWDRAITDAHFPHSSLIPGREYAAEVYQHNCDMVSQSLVDIGLANKRVLVGARGGALLGSRYREKLPINKWVVFIDEEEYLLRDHHALVPHDDSNRCLCLDCWEVSWLKGAFTVFFRELP